MAKLERIYTVPLGDAYSAVRNKRVPRAVKMLRAFIARHMKAEDERILLSSALNSHLWERSIQKPPRRVKVRLVKDEGEIKAYLADEKVEAKETKKSEAKKEEKKAEEPRKEAPKPKEAPKKEEPKKEAPKPEPARKEAPKREEHKR